MAKKRAKSKKPVGKKKAPTKKVAKKIAKKKAKAAKVNYLPKGFHTVVPYMCVKDAAFALEFYKKAFGAKEILRLTSPDGKIGHAEFTIGDSHLMIGDEAPQMGAVSAESMGGSPIKLNISVKNVDAFFAKALASGATLVRPVMDQFYGMRSGMVPDPFGYAWFIGTQTEIVTPAQLKKRWARMVAEMKAPEAKA